MAQDPVSEPPELEPLYYLANFEQLCASVLVQYEDLLQPAERQFLTSFQSLDEGARGLYVRLVSRRGELFRREQLDYPELGNLDRAISQAVAVGLLSEVTEPPVDELLALLRKDELLEIFGPGLGLKNAMRKPDLQEVVLSALEPPQVVACWQDWLAPDNGLVAVELRAVVELFQLLFFGNRRQSLTDFVLSDLGVSRYFPYLLDPEFRLFRTREQIEEYLQLGQLSDLYYEAVEAGDDSAVLDMVPELSESSGRDMLEGRRDRLRNRVARQLERADECNAALSLYQRSARHPARERRTRLLTAAGQYQEALTLCDDIHDAPWCEAEVDFARRQQPGLRKKLGMEYQPVARDCFTEDRVSLAKSNPVELAAAAHYAQEWQQVHYVENSLFNGSFGLAFWEQIFQSVPGAFVNPFQSAPLDMYSPGFYANRREAIEQRLSQLLAGDLPAEILTAWDRYRDLSNRWVSWRYLSRELLQTALACIPVEHWLLIWRRILFDPEANRSGCPDLLALDDDKGYCLIEVKGPGDQLQLNQRRWLRFFQQNDIPACVSWVQWSDD